MRIASFKLPEELDQSLTAMARERHVSRSALVREAIENLAKPTRRSALDLAGSLVGSLDRPSDLSTSPRHMKGFGK